MLREWAVRVMSSENIHRADNLVISFPDKQKLKRAEKMNKESLKF